MIWPYGKYIEFDNAFTIVPCEKHAIELFNCVANQDPDSLLNWEIDYPKSPGNYIPSLGTSVCIDTEGSLHYSRSKMVTFMDQLLHNFFITIDDSRDL